MDPLTLATLALEGIKVGKGLYDNAQGNQIANSTVRPTYGIPSAETEYLKRAHGLTTATLPGTSQMQDNVSAGTSAGIRSLTEAGNNPAAIMAGVAALTQNQNTAMNSIGVANANYQAGNERNYQGALQGEAAYQDKAFEYNQNQPYQNAMTAARALKGSGIQNAYQGATDLAGTAFGSGTVGSMYGNTSNTNPNTNFNNINFTPEQLYNIWKFKNQNSGINGLGTTDLNYNTSNIG